MIRKKNNPEGRISLFGFPQKYKPLLLKTAEKTLSNCRKVELSSINIIFITDSEIKELNKKYRNVYRVTDIISFLINPVLFSGDIYIAKGRSKKQAKEYGNSWGAELSYLVIHGILHLFGYTDYTPKERKQMFKKQDKIFKELSGIK
jgi:probable rRNA maturation factor